MSNRINFKTKSIKKYKEGNYIMTNGSIQEEIITHINMYTLNIGEVKYVKQMLTEIKEEVKRNKKIVGDFYTPLTSMDRSFR